MSLNIAMSIGMISGTQSQALFATMAAYAIGIIMCGVYWSIEAQPYYLRALTVGLPTSWITPLFQSCFLNDAMVIPYAKIATVVIVAWGTASYWFNVAWVRRFVGVWEKGAV